MGDTYFTMHKLSRVLIKKSKRGTKSLYLFESLSKKQILENLSCDEVIVSSETALVPAHGCMNYERPLSEQSHRQCWVKNLILF